MLEESYETFQYQGVTISKKVQSQLSDSKYVLLQKLKDFEDGVDPEKDYSALGYNDPRSAKRCITQLQNTLGAHGKRLKNINFIKESTEDLEEKVDESTESKEETVIPKKLRYANFAVYFRENDIDRMSDAAKNIVRKAYSGLNVIHNLGWSDGQIGTVAGNAIDSLTTGADIYDMFFQKEGDAKIIERLLVCANESLEQSEPTEKAVKEFKIPRNLHEQHFFAYFLEKNLDFNTPEALDVAKKVYFAHSKYLELNKKPENIIVSAKRVANPHILGWGSVKDNVAMKKARSGDANIIEFLLDYAQTELKTAGLSDINELLEGISVSCLEGLIGVNLNGLIITEDILKNSEARKYVVEVVKAKKNEHRRMADLYDAIMK